MYFVTAGSVSNQIPTPMMAAPMANNMMLKTQKMTGWYLQHVGWLDGSVGSASVISHDSGILGFVAVKTPQIRRMVLLTQSLN